MSALAMACGVTVGDLWSRAQDSSLSKVKSPEEVVAERVNKLFAVAQAQFPKLDVQGALLASDVAQESQPDSPALAGRSCRRALGYHR